MSHAVITPIEDRPISTMMRSLSSAYRRFAERGYQPAENVTAENAGEFNHRYPRRKPPRNSHEINQRRLEALRLWRETNKTSLEIALILECDRSSVSAWVRLAGLSRLKPDRNT